MAPPLVALAGLLVGGLAAGSAVLGAAVTGMSVGPADTSPMAGATTVAVGAPALNVAESGAVQAAAAQCPGLDWTLLAGGVLVDPALAAGLASVATDLCLVPPDQRPDTLTALLPGPTEGEVALVLSHALNTNPTLNTAVAQALAFAASNLGAPYRWGGTGSGGFDCSGLTQAAYKAAQVSLPRVAQDQYDAGPAVPVGAALEPGDLVFFGSGQFGVSHVGLYIGGGLMIDAPHTGAFVRIEATPTTPGASFGEDLYIGATRPAS
jgi:cell wall-associated NlpC family hydrolase